MKTFKQFYLQFRPQSIASVDHQCGHRPIKKLFPPSMMRAVFSKLDGFSVQS